MKHLVLSILVIALLLVVGYCIYLAGQIILSGFQTQSVLLSSAGCYFNGAVLTCKF